jgi:serine/threonine protein kinase
VLQPKRSSLQFILDSFDPQMSRFISKLLTLDPDERPSAEEALNDPWLVS